MSSTTADPEASWSSYFESPWLGRRLEQLRREPLWLRGRLKQPFQALLLPQACPSSDCTSIAPTAPMQARARGTGCSGAGKAFSNAGHLQLLLYVCSRCLETGMLKAHMTPRHDYRNIYIYIYIYMIHRHIYYAAASCNRDMQVSYAKCRGGGRLL